MPVWQPLVVVGGLLDFGVGVFEDAVGVAVGVHAGLTGVESGWGIHSTVPLCIRTVQPVSASRLCGPQASTSTSMSVVESLVPLWFQVSQTGKNCR